MADITKKANEENDTNALTEEFINIVCGLAEKTKEELLQKAICLHHEEVERVLIT